MDSMSYFVRIEFLYDILHFLRELNIEFHFKDFNSVNYIL